MRKVFEKSFEHWGAYYLVTVQGWTDGDVCLEIEGSPPIWLPLSVEKASELAAALADAVGAVKTALNEPKKIPDPPYTAE